MGDVMTGERKLEPATARAKEGVGSLLKALVLLCCITLGIAGLVGIVLFLLWILGVP